MKPLLTLLLFCLSFLNYAQTTAKEWYEKGLAATNNEDKIYYYTKSIQLDPNDKAAYNNRGLAKNNLSRHQEAIADYNKAIQLDPKYAKAYNNRGIPKDDLGRYQEAIDDYDKAIQLDPNYATAYINRGVSKKNLGRTQEAIGDYDKAIQLDPNYALAYFNRGSLKYGLGRYQEAISDCDKAIQLNPNDADTYYNRGISKYNLGRYQEAIGDYEKAIQLNPNFAKAYLAKGQSLVNLSRYCEALPMFTQGERLDNSLSFHKEDKKKAQQQCQNPVSPPLLTKRYALVIGNSTYLHGNSLLGRPVNDASDVAKRLTSLGFEVTTIINGKREEMLNQLLGFGNITDADFVVFFFAGHGIEVSNENYLLPTDAHLTHPSAAGIEAISVRQILSQLKRIKAKANLTILDACRNDPFRSWSSDVRSDDQRGFKVIQDIRAEGNMYLATATGWGNVAQNGTGRNGVYTESLLKYLVRGKALDEVLDETSIEVNQKTEWRQNPQLVREISRSLKVVF